MPILKVDDGTNSSRVGHYLNFDREGSERAEAFRANTPVGDVKEAEREFRLVREQFGKKDGPEFHQFYISYQRSDLGSLEKADGTPDWDRMARYGEEWARRAGISDRHQFYVVAHGDKPHPHIHIIVNATSFEDGKKYHFHGRKELDRFRDINDDLAREHAIERILDRHPDKERAPNGVIRAAEKGGDRYSWKMDLQCRIRAAASESLGETQFRRELKTRGVDVRVRAGEYTFAFKDDLEKSRQARGRSLGEEYERKPLKDRFEAHFQMTREPHGFSALAEKAKAEKGALDSWRRELRQVITDSKRRAPDFERFRSGLASRGVVVEAGADGHLRYHVAAGPQGPRREITDRELGRVYDQGSLERHFEQNAFRRHATSEIGKVVRQAQAPEELSRRLKERGIEVSRVGDRYVYEIPYRGEMRRVEGEQLGAHLRTERVEDRFAVNRDRRDLYQIAIRARHGTDSREQYLERLSARGIAYRPGEGGKAQFEFRGRTYDVGALGKANPDRESAGPIGSLGRGMTREAGGLARDLTKEISRASHEGYHDHGVPDHGRERDRARKRGCGLDSNSSGAEAF